METNQTPTYIRLPKSGQLCPYSGLRRSFLNFLTLPSKTNNWNPPVDSRVIKKDGTRRGVKLISYSSLIKFLNSQPDAKSVAEAAEKGGNHV
jgi:hypothetical protein